MKKNQMQRRLDASVYGADVQKKIVCIRGQLIILDADVAELYGVETKRVNEAVRNNPDVKTANPPQTPTASLMPGRERPERAAYKSSSL